MSHAVVALGVPRILDPFVDVASVDGHLLLTSSVVAWIAGSMTIVDCQVG